MRPATSQRGDTALHSFLFSGGISISSTYEMSDRLQNVRSDITFDIVHYTYIHGGPISKSCRDSVAPRTRRTAHRTLTHAGPSHAHRRAEHGVFFRVCTAYVQLELWPPQVGPAICATCAPTRKKDSCSMLVEKKLLSAAQGARQVVSEGG